jgi:hypothetical protein
VEKSVITIKIDKSSLFGNYKESDLHLRVTYWHPSCALALVRTYTSRYIDIVNRDVPILTTYRDASQLKEDTMV